VGAEQENSVARLSVADEGPGLAPEDVERAFARFWRGRDGKPGSGLGLAIVRATAERHGGRAYAEGSRFTIELPVLKEPAEPSLRDLSGSAPTKEEQTPGKGSP
ncbi:MAG: HAMP domain-containing histidine kinase, partial [Actinomycetota bacterium]|nr:HAMP domain-containing histidine kinase [Actinomycetota bacterium]